MVEKDNTVQGENFAMNRLAALLPSMPLIEGVKISTLADVKKLDKVGVNLMLAHFSKNVRQKNNGLSLSRSLLDC